MKPKLKIFRAFLPVLILGGLLIHSGCGTMWSNNLDVIGFPKDGPELTIRVKNADGEKDYVLNVGDRMELQNMPGNYGLGQIETCFYMANFFGDHGSIILITGYDPDAKNTDGSSKHYSNSMAWTHWSLNSKYQLRIIPKSGQPQTLDIPYGTHGFILFALNAYRHRNSQNTYSADSIFNSLNVPQGGDRTICFDVGKFAQLEVGTLINVSVILIDEIGPPPEDPNKKPIDTSNETFTNPDKGTGDSTVAGGTTGGTTAATSPKGGCSSLHRETSASSQIWLYGYLLWVPAALAILKRRKMSGLRSR